MTQDIKEHAVTPRASTIPPARSRKWSRQPSPSFAWLEEPYNHTRGEMSLWTAVILQAMVDALSKVNNAEAIYHKNEAIHWLTENSKDFVMVCQCAGLDPDVVRRKAKRTLIAPIPWRAEPRKGKRYLERKGYRSKNKSRERHKSCKSQNDHADSADSDVNSAVILHGAFAARRA